MIEDVVAGAVEWALVAPRRSPQRWILLTAIVVAACIAFIVFGG